MEGTIATAQQLLLFEVGTEPETPDVQEVHNYITAMRHGLDRLGKLPMCLRLICELHVELMKEVRGEEHRPGEFRNGQNAIGKKGQAIDEARFVPPPVLEMRKTLNDLEKFLNTANDLTPLVELALVHYQFETIHPFRDGNGRIGRLLIPLMMCQKNLLSKPLLYLSAYFEKNRNRYNDLLFNVSAKGDWLAWVNFFLKAVVEQATDAVKRADKLLSLNQQYRDRFHKRSSALLLKLIDGLFAYPAVAVPEAKKKLKVSFVSAQNNIDKLVKAGILREVTGRQRNRIYVAEEIVRLIEAPSV